MYAYGKPPPKNILQPAKHMLKHPRQREGLRVLEKLCKERISNSESSGKDTADVHRRPETKVLVQGSTRQKQTDYDEARHTYSMALQKCITG